MRLSWVCSVNLLVIILSLHTGNIYICVCSAHSFEVEFEIEVLFYGIFALSQNTVTLTIRTERFSIELRKSKTKVITLASQSQGRRLSSEPIKTSDQNSKWLHEAEEKRGKICVLIGLKSCFYNSMETERAQAVDVMMARAKRIYILIIKVNKLFSLFSSWCFLKEIENMFSFSQTSTRVSITR